MDFYLIIFFLFTGILLGFKLDEENNFVKLSEEETTLLNEKAKKVIYTYDYSIEKSNPHW